MCRPTRLCLLGVIFIATIAGGPAFADGPVKVKLVSPNGMNDVEGTAMLQGETLSGHIVGNGVDFMLSGQVKRRSVSVDLAGRISPSCGLSRQSMSGLGHNDHGATMIQITLSCSGKAGNWGGGEEYIYQLHLDLPSPALLSPAQSGTGESASLE
jgi:hypothetical protein